MATPGILTFVETELTVCKGGFPEACAECPRSFALIKAKKAVTSNTTSRFMIETAVADSNFRV